MPDNVLFEENTGTRIRSDLMDKCELHTILRLPTGIFYAQGVKTNVLYFTRGSTDTGTTRETWVFDLRANMPSFGKRTPLTRAHFAEFEAAYGDDPHGKAPRSDQGETGRFRRFEDLPTDDYRRTSPRFQGANFQKNLDLVNRVGEIARKKGVSPGQLALAWVLAQGRDIVPIPGTTCRPHLDENAAALEIELTPAELEEIKQAMPEGAAAGERYPEPMMKRINR